MVNGDIAPLLVISLIERLPEGSKTVSMMQGNQHWRAFLDIGPMYYVLAGIFNAINGNTIATGNFKKRPKFDPWPTPQEVVKKKSRRPKSVMDIYKKFTAGR